MVKKGFFFFVTREIISGNPMKGLHMLSLWERKLH